MTGKIKRYRTWWAYGIYGIALVIAFNFAVKWRSRQVIREKEKLEQALRENPPRLLFLSGSNTAKTPGDTTGRTGADIPGTTAEGSFTRLMAESHRVPAVLGWGHYMTDAPAIFAAKILFKELSRGRSILDAVQRVRFELQEEFHGPGQGSWAFLRLYGDGTAMTALVKNNQNQKPGPRKMKHIYFQRFYLRNITG